MRRRTFFILGAAVLASVALLSTSKGVSNTSFPADGERVTESAASHLRHSAPKRSDSTAANVVGTPSEPSYSEQELLPAPENISDIDLSTVPKGTIVFEYHSLDELRENEGLPAVDAALVVRNDFPKETPREAADADLHALYQMDRNIHRAKYLAQHKVIERNRFWSRLQNSEDEGERPLLLSSAKYHARIAAAQQKRHDALVEERTAMISNMRERRLHE